MLIFTETNHLSEEALSLLALNDLPEAERVSVNRHLDNCPNCRRQMREAGEFIRNFRLVVRQVPSVGVWAGR